MAAQGKSQDIEPGIIARVTAGVRYAFGGRAPDAWFGPSQPLQPMAQAPEQQVVGRQFDYPVGYNTRTRPRGEEAVSFDDMRAVAQSYDLLRIVIETRKDQLSRLKWTIRPKDKKAPSDARCQQLIEFFESPDRSSTWADWLRAVLDDLFVIDAPTLYPRLTRGGQLYSIEHVDGATIKRVIDAGGRTPLPPDPAYQQIFKGVPAVDYTSDELIYKPRNRRTHKLYGFSPVEQIITTVNIGIRRQTQQLEFFTSGSVPDGLLAVPEDWTPEQIKSFQVYWDSILSGNLGERSKMRMVPGKSAYIATKDAILKNEFDEWIARVICYTFGVAHSAFVKEPSKATAGTSAEVAQQEGLMPLMQWVVDLINLIIRKYFGYKDLTFSWDEEAAVDPLEQAQILQIYVASGIMDANEARTVIGLAAKTPEELEAMKPAQTPGFGGDGSGDEKTPSKTKPNGGDKTTADDKTETEEASPAQKISKALIDNGGLHVHVNTPDVVVDFCPVVHIAK